MQALKTLLEGISFNKCVQDILLSLFTKIKETLIRRLVRSSSSVTFSYLREQLDVKDDLIIEKVNEMKSDYYLDLIDAIVFRNIQEREEMETFMDINTKIKRKID